MAHHARIVMKRATSKFELGPLPSPLTVRSISAEDAPTLSLLLYAAYEGTIDDEGESLEETEEEARQALGGKYGDVIWPASIAVFHNLEMVGVSLISEFPKFNPLLTFAATAPHWQGRGIAGELIKRSLNALSELSIESLFLVVTDGNPAKTIYDRLGFIEQSRAVPNSVNS